jgi:hypothetical protein
VKILKSLVGRDKGMNPTTVKLRQSSGLLLITGLSVSMITLVVLGSVGILPYPVGLLNILGFWLLIVFVILAAKAIFVRRHRNYLK